MAIYVDTTIMQEAMVEEIKATKWGNLDGKKIEAEIDKGIESSLSKNREDIPSYIVTIGLTASYDMGWNKRSIGKVYDSLLGQGFLICF